MNYSHIGKETPYYGSVDKVTGKAQYTDDLRLHHPLHIKILRSPHASARIVSISTEKAKALAGVKGIITGSDFSRPFGVLPISKDEWPLAKDVVRYVGEPVVAIAAESPRQALAALKAIVVTYEEKKPILLGKTSLNETQEPIHPELGKNTNIHKSVDQSFGDIDKGFTEADVIVEDEFKFSAVTHAFTEPHATQVAIDASGDLTVYSATQVPHYLHLALAEVLAVPLYKIRVIKPALGGGFGGKSDPFPHEMIAAKLALLTGRNVRITFEREDVFFSHHGRHETEISCRLGLSKDKGITALKAKMLIDGGAYGSFGIVTSYYNGVLLQGPYKIPNFAFHCDRVYTNKPMCGAMRGHGGVNPRFASEVLLDQAFEKLNLDPCEARLKMFLDPESLTANEFRITSVGIRSGLKNAIERSQWKEKYKKLPYGKGIGVACGFFISGSALPIHWTNMPQSTVRMTIDFDGGVTIYSGASDIGQGSDTVLLQMAAEVLGLPTSVIKVISADTRLCPIDYGSYSSRVTFMAGNAARNAAISLRRTLLEAACKIWKITPPASESPNDEVNFFRQGQRKPRYDNAYLGANPDYQDGFIFSDQTITSPAGETLNYFDVVKAAMDFNGTLQSQGIYISPKMGGKFKGSGAGQSPSYSFTAFIVEVAVNPATGFVKVEKVTAAHDCGQVLNPLAVEGQIEGSIHMGLGQALMESMTYKRGAVQNPSFLEYKILSPFEQPEIDIVPCDNTEIEGPFGAKEVGEGPLAPIIPAVANAIYNAVGVRINQLPITPDKVYNAIMKHKR